MHCGMMPAIYDWNKNKHLQSAEVVCRAPTRTQQHHIISPTLRMTHHLSHVDYVLYPDIPHGRRNGEPLHYHRLERSRSAWAYKDLFVSVTTCIDMA